MKKSKAGDKVKVHYIGKLQDGTIFDSTLKKDPLEFTLGKEEVIAGFEKAVIGMKEGANADVKIIADEAYGPHRKELIASIDREKFPKEKEIKPGDRFNLKSEKGKNMIATVTDVSDNIIIIDANHPLAGEDLFFNIKLVQII